MEKIHQLTKQTMELVGQTVRNTPTVPTVPEMKLRLALEFEELFEKAQAMGLEHSFEILIVKSLLKRSVEKHTLSSIEYAELEKAFDEPTWGFLTDTNEVNLVEVLDAALDQRVVASGTDLCFGMQNCIVEGDRAVWTSNMSKFDTDIATAFDGVTAYKNGTHPHSDKKIECYVHSTDGYHIIKNSENHKYLKSLNYSPVDLRSLVGVVETVNTEENGTES